MLTTKQLEELTATLPEKTFTSEEILKKHGSNLFHVSDYFPDVVCYAESDDDIIKVVNFCVRNKTPLIPYGSGTSVEGHTAAVEGGVCLNLSKMNKILDLNLVDGYVIVQAGIPYNELNDVLVSHGFHFAVEAGWGASIGGMLSTNASGAGAIDSGSMAKNVLGCSLIMYETNAAIKTKLGTKSQKSSAGYNLMGLVIGAEGTLGVVSEVCLKIRRNFTSSKTICCQFNEIQQAIDFVVDIKGLVQFRRAELLDKLQTEACIRHSKINSLYTDKNTLIIELAGNEVVITEELRLVTHYLNKHHTEYLKVFDDKKSSEQIWMMRKNACQAAIQFIDSNKKAVATDISVPLSKLNECIQACYQHMKKLGIVAPLVAHVGDGNFHFTILINPNNNDDVQKIKTFNQKIIQEALKVGGTCSGEHGIGIGKISSLELEHGDSLFLMRRIKTIFDPLNIFNPGKILQPKHNCLSYQENSTIQNSSNLSCTERLFHLKM